MRVLVTRAKSSAETTLRRLAAAGHEVLSLPMSEAEHLPVPVPGVLPTALVATSAEVFRMLERLPDVVVALAGIPLYCVGPATAEAALDLGFSQVRVGPGDGAGLAARVIDDFRDADPDLLYLAGMPRTAVFETLVAEAGLQLRVDLLYRMRPLHRDAGELAASVEAFRPDAILFYSRETARLFFSEIAPAMLPERVRILCLGPGIAEAVPPGCPEVEVAARPDEDGLLLLLDA